MKSSRNTLQDRTAVKDTKTVYPCPFCRKDRVRGERILRGFTYLECGNCGTFRRHPHPLVEERTRFYREEYSGSYLSTQDRPERKEMLSQLLRRLTTTEGQRLLDIGAGNGQFVSFARDSGWEAEGTELSHHLRQLAQSRYGIHLRDPDREANPQGSYDWVTLINVLDQAPDPIELLLEAKNALRPKGSLLIRVPNALFHFNWIRATIGIGLARFSRLAVLHDYGFTAKSLKASLLINGFETREVRNANLARSLALGGECATTFLTFTMKALVKSTTWLSRGRLLLGPSIEVEAERLET